jgi:hypothetical protein
MLFSIFSKKKGFHGARAPFEVFDMETFIKLALQPLETRPSKFKKNQAFNFRTLKPFKLWKIYLQPPESI